MRKRDERTNPKSCWNKARDDEFLFVLLERDDAFPGTVRFWIQERIRLGLNKPGDAKLLEAEREAEMVELSQRLPPRGIVDGRTPEELKADGDDKWPDSTPYIPPKRTQRKEQA